MYNLAQDDLKGEEKKKIKAKSDEKCRDDVRNVALNKERDPIAFDFIFYHFYDLSPDGIFLYRHEKSILHKIMPMFGRRILKYSMLLCLCKKKGL